MVRTQVMVDFHTHILPQMDDGSRSVEESIQMLCMLQQQEVKWVAATPHYYAEDEAPNKFLERRKKSYENLLPAMQQYGGLLPPIRLGAEVRYFTGMSQSAEIARLTLEGTNLLLLEIPFVSWNNRMLKEIYQLQQYLHVQVVLAHIERYLPLQKRFSFWKDLEELNVLIQSNASFFIEKANRRKAFKLFDKGRIHLLGSDCHHVSVRPPNIHVALSVLQQKYGDAICNWLEEQDNI